MSLLEQDTTKKKQIDDGNVAKLEAGDDNSKKYKVEAI